MKADSPILVTGVGKRIGFALTESFLTAGQRVIGTYRTNYPELEKLRGLGAELYQCDFQREREVSGLIESITDRYTSLRALIHNASDWLPDSSRLEGSVEVMQQMMNVHVNMPYMMNRAFEPLLKAYSNGVANIIHITDYVATTGSKKHIAYAASKAAAQNLVLSFAAKFAPDIMVNAVAPALILFNDGDSEAYKKKALKKSLIEREGGISEVIEAINYLLKTEYMTGRTLHLDGGRHINF